jgi:hypothetical protein
MNKLIRKRFDISIMQPGKRVSGQIELDKTVKYIKGLLLTSDKDDLLYFRGSAKIEINKEEYFPDNYEAKLLMSGINTSPNGRYYDLAQVPSGNGIVKIDYTDTPDARTTFVPYRVSLYLLCEIPE